MSAVNHDFMSLLSAGIKRVITTYCPADISQENADSSISVHRHQRREFVYVYEGEYDFVLDNRRYHLTPGSLVFIDSWQTHSNWYNEGKRPLIHLWGHIKPKKIKIAMIELDASDKLNYTHIASTGSFICPLLNDRCAKIKQSAPVEPEVRDMYLHKVFEVLFEEFRIDLANAASVPGNQEKLVELLSAYIRENQGRDCSLRQLEQVSGYSQHYISHVFRKALGQSLGQFIDEVRLEYVSEALNAGRCFKEIAGEVGFANYGSFWKWHKKHRNREAVKTSRKVREGG